MAFHRKRDPTMRYVMRQKLVEQIAGECRTTASAVRQWKQVPWNRVLVVESITGRPRHLIRPDIYPPPRPATENPKELTHG